MIAASVDSHFSHYNWAEMPRDKGGLGKMTIPMLSDLTKQVSKDYGCLTPDGGVALRSTFIIDDKGILRHASHNDLNVGRSVDEFLRLVQAFQYGDKHGEVCPANWKPGSKTMEPKIDSEKTKKYWKTEHAH